MACGDPPPGMVWNDCTGFVPLYSGTVVPTSTAVPIGTAQFCSGVVWSTGVDLSGVGSTAASADSILFGWGAETDKERSGEGWVTVPAFPIISNPTILLSDLRKRRFNIVDRLPVGARFRELVHMAACRISRRTYNEIAKLR